MSNRRHTQRRRSVKEGRLPGRSGQRDRPLPLLTCPVHGVDAYRSRAAAKKAARAYHPNVPLTATACDHLDAWHLTPRRTSE